MDMLPSATINYVDVNFVFNVYDVHVEYMYMYSLIQILHIYNQFFLVIDQRGLDN